MTGRAAEKMLHVELLEPGRYRVECAGSCGGELAAHVVTIGADVAACDCPAGVWGHPCKHLAAVTAHLQLAPLEPKLPNALGSFPQLAKALASSAGPGLTDVDVPPPDLA